MNNEEQHNNLSWRFLIYGFIFIMGSVYLLVQDVYIASFLTVVIGFVLLTMSRRHDKKYHELKQKRLTDEWELANEESENNEFDHE